MNNYYHVKLKEERLRKKWTQQKTSNKIGISRSYYSDIENGRSFPSGKTLFKINEILPIFLPIHDVNTNQKEVSQ